MKPVCPKVICSLFKAPIKFLELREDDEGNKRGNETRLPKYDERETWTQDPYINAELIFEKTSQRVRKGEIRYPKNDAWDNHRSQHEEVENLLEPEFLLREEKRGAGTDKGGKERHSKGHPQRRQYGPQVHCVIKDADPLRPLADKPIQCKPIPRKGWKIRVVERQ